MPPGVPQDAVSAADRPAPQDAAPSAAEAAPQPDSAPVAGAVDGSTEQGPLTPAGPTPPAPPAPPSDPTVDPYIDAVEDAARSVTAQLDASGVPFDALTEPGFEAAQNQAAVLQTLAAAIPGGHQALIDRFLGIRPDPERHRPPVFGSGNWIPSRRRLGELVAAVNAALPATAQLTLPTGTATAVRQDLHTQIAALGATERATIADAMVDHTVAQTTRVAERLLGRLRIALRLAGLQLMADTANANIGNAGLEQPGRWAARDSEVGGETRPSSRYEQLVTGSPKGIAYTVADTAGTHASDFDGIRVSVDGRFELLDSKADYRRLVPGRGVPRLQGEASRQILAADGRPIVWVSQYGGAQLTGLRGIVSWAISNVGAGPSTPFTVSHETTRRQPPTAGQPAVGSPPTGAPPTGGTASPPSTPASPPSAPPAPSSDQSSSRRPHPTAPAADSPAATTAQPATAAPGHPVSAIRASRVMDVPGTAFHGDAAGAPNTAAVTDAVVATMAETVTGSERNRIADAAGLQRLDPTGGTGFAAVTGNGNPVRVSIEVGATPTSAQGHSPLVLIERTDTNPVGSSDPTAYTVTVSDHALAEHVGQALADAFAQVSALADGHTTRERVLSRNVQVDGPLFANDFSVTDLGTVGAIRYLQHSIDATHGKHRLQAMHMRHLVNVLADAGMMLTPDEVNTLMRPYRPDAATLPSLTRLVALPADIHHVVLAANIDPDAESISTGMPTRGVYLARAMLQHGVAGLASGVTIALIGAASGNAPLAALRGATMFGGRMLGAVSQAQGERLQAQRKAWIATHNKANSIVRGGHLERAAHDLLEQALDERQRRTEQARHADGALPATPRPRPGTPRIPGIMATAGRYGSAGLTSELVNVASLQAATMANAALEQVMLQTVVGTPAALVGALSTIIGEQYLLNQSDAQAAPRKAADDAIERDVAGTIRDLIDLAAAVHTLALDHRSQTIDDLTARAAGGEQITAEHLTAVPAAPTFDQTLQQVGAAIQQQLAVGPDAEADLLALVEAAERAQTKIATVRRTPTPERLALHAKLHELGMVLPDGVHRAEPGTPEPTARAQEQASRAWVHKWLGLRTPDLADRLARMALRPSAVASLGAYTLKGILSGGVGSGATMATFGVATGLDPAVVAVETLVSTVMTGLVAGSLEHGVQTAAENQSQLTNPTRVHQSLSKIAAFAPGIDITTSIIEHLEAQQQRQLDALRGDPDAADDRPGGVARNVREQTLEVLFSTFGHPDATTEQVAGINHYGSRALGSLSASSLTYAGLSGEVNNLPAGLVSAVSTHFGEGIIKHSGARSEVLRKAQLERLTTRYHAAQASRELAVQRGEHIDDVPPNATFAPPPRQGTPFDSDVANPQVAGPHRLQVGEVPTIRTVTTSSMTVTIDLQNNRATIIDHRRPGDRAPEPHPDGTHAHPPSDPRAADRRQAPTGAGRTTDVDATEPSASTSPVHGREPGRSVPQPPRRLTNFVRGAQWREPWWRTAPLPPFVAPPAADPEQQPMSDPAAQRPPRLPADESPAPTRPQQPSRTAPPVGPQQPNPTAPPVRPGASHGPRQPQHAPSPSSPHTADGPRQTGSGPSGPSAPGTPPSPPASPGSCPCTHRGPCGLAAGPAGDRGLSRALDATRLAARLLGARLVATDTDDLRLELADGSVLRLHVERAVGTDAEALEVRRDADLLAVQVNVRASEVDIALDVVSGVTAAGRFAAGTPVAGAVFGDSAAPGGTSFSISDHQHLARLALLLELLGGTDCRTDLRTYRELVGHELGAMGIEAGDPYAVQRWALLPDPLRGELLELDLHPAGSGGPADPAGPGG